MRLPTIPQPGRPIDTSWAKQVIDYLQALTWQSTPSLKVSIGTGGTTGNVISPWVQAASVKIRPLEIILTSSKADDGSVTDYLSLYPGTVGGIYPKVDDKFLWQIPSDGAGGFLDHPRMEIELPASAGDPPLFVWLKAKCLTGVVVEVTCETGATVPENTVEYGYVRLGYINSDGTVYQEAYGPISYFLAFALDPSNPIGHEFVAR